MRRKHGYKHRRTTRGINSDSGGGAGGGSAASFALGYLFRVTEERINHIAAEVGDPAAGPDLARRLAKLLQAKAGREMDDHSEFLHEVRRGSTARNEERIGEETLHVRSRRTKPLNLGRKRLVARMYYRSKHSKNARLRKKAQEWLALQRSKKQLKEAA